VRQNVQIARFDFFPGSDIDVHAEPIPDTVEEPDCPQFGGMSNTQAADDFREMFHRVLLTFGARSVEICVGIPRAGDPSAWQQLAEV
jgi:hypothetical protein